MLRLPSLDILEPALYMGLVVRLYTTVAVNLEYINLQAAISISMYDASTKECLRTI